VTRDLIARSLVVATIVVGGFGVVAGTALAEPERAGHSGGTSACPVVATDSSGNETTTYVPHGTKLNGLICKDGTWVYAKSAKDATTAGGEPAAASRA
jgi:hypothetical protein